MNSFIKQQRIARYWSSIKAHNASSNVCSAVIDEILLQTFFALQVTASRPGGLYVLLLFLIFNASFQTDYLQICRVGRIMAVDDQSEISFSIPQGTWTNFWWFYPQ